jgi:hypothetical protein
MGLLAAFMVIAGAALNAIEVGDTDDTQGQNGSENENVIGIVVRVRLHELPAIRFNPIEKSARVNADHARREIAHVDSIVPLELCQIFSDLSFNSREPLSATASISVIVVDDSSLCTVTKQI